MMVNLVKSKFFNGGRKEKINKEKQYIQIKYG